MKFASGHLPHAKKLFDLQVLNETLDVLRADHEQAVRFFPVTGNLRQELVGGHTGGNSDTHLIFHSFAQVLRHQRGTALMLGYLADIQEGFVQRQRLHQIGQFPQNGHHLFRHRPVAGHIRRHGHQAGAQAPGFAARHGGPHAKSPRFIVAGGNHSAATFATHGQRNFP